MTLQGHYVYSGTTDAQMATAVASDFVIVKASQNLTYVNPKHDAQVQQTRDGGAEVGHFHFAWPPTSDPVAHAKAFVAAAKPQAGDILSADLENDSWTTDDVKAAPNWLLTFRDVVCDLSGARTCWHYTNKSFGQAVVNACTDAQRVELFKMPLWLADYSSTVTTTLGWPTWTAWQRSGSFDTPETFNGDREQWRALGVPVATTLTQEDLDNIVKAVRADAGKTAQQPDGSWPLGAILVSRGVEAVVGSLRSEGVSGAADDSEELAALAALPAELVEAIKALTFKAA